MHSNTYFSLPLPDPGAQFALVAEHIGRIRSNVLFAASSVIIYVERNLGFEAEHHKRALEGMIPGRVSFYHDAQHDRTGMLTTNPIKHAMCRLVVVMLEEGRIRIRSPLFSRDPKGVVVRLREQMEVYSSQYKMAATSFQKDAVAVSGKVGGMKDDICICLQLACYFTQIGHQRLAGQMSMG